MGILMWDSWHLGLVILTPKEMAEGCGWSCPVFPQPQDKWSRGQTDSSLAEYKVCPQHLTTALPHPQGLWSQRLQLWPPGFWT